jgi:hypothetical protein
MSNSIIAWDIETIPDLKGFAAASGHAGKSDDEIRAAMGDKFPKHIYHSIICIGALVAHQDNDRWIVDALGAPHVGERPEKALISSFVDRIADAHATACHVQRFILRSSRSTISGHGSCSSGAGAIITTLF